MLNANFQMLTISRHVLHLSNTRFDEVFVAILCKFPHYWVCFANKFCECGKVEIRTDCQKSGFSFKACDTNNSVVVVCFFRL